MKDYSDLGLNDKLQSVNSLTNRPITSIYDLDAITANKSKIASLNSLSGGTLVLGGTTNGDGVFNLRTAAGSNLITMNNSGIEINNIAGGPATPLNLLSGIRTASIYMNGSTFQIDNLNDRIRFETDDSNIELLASAGTIHINMGSTTNTGIVRFVEGAGASAGTVAELNASGNLRISGTLGTGVTF